MKRTQLQPRAIGDRARIEVLASPVRHELVDTLSALGGEASASQLAEHLGRHVDGLYYHLRLLCDSGLVSEVKANARGERLYRLAGRGRAPLRLAYRIGPKGNAQALRTYSQGLLKVAGRDFERGLTTEGVIVEGKRRQLWAARNKGWVSENQLFEINELLERLCQLTSQPRGGDHKMLMSCAFVMAPISARPKRRSG